LSPDAISTFEEAGSEEVSRKEVKNFKENNFFILKDPRSN
jgi:hypothetical protein